MTGAGFLKSGPCCCIERYQSSEYSEILRMLGTLGSIIFINRVVFTFHVPIFFFITGYFMNSKCGIKDYARNKLRTLIIPYIVTCIVIVMLGTLNGFIQGGLLWW